MNNISTGNYEIVAVDFDGTLCVDCYPHIGAPNLALIRILREWQLGHTKLILWTCRCGDALDNAISWCAEQGLFFDAINANVPETIAKYGSDPRKITADIYIDDKSCLPWSTSQFDKVV